MERLAHHLKGAVTAGDDALLELTRGLVDPHEACRDLLSDNPTPETTDYVHQLRKHFSNALLSLVLERVFDDVEQRPMQYAGLQLLEGAGRFTSTMRRGEAIGTIEDRFLHIGKSIDLLLVEATQTVLSDAREAGKATCRRCDLGTTLYSWILTRHFQPGVGRLEGR